MSNGFWVEILKPGKWTASQGQQVDISSDDLDQILASHNEIYPDVEPCLRLGDHPALGKDVKPAIGWVPKLKREGDRLLAFFTDVPEIVFKAFEAKRYKKVSAGLWKNWRYQGKTHPLVLNHVAVLGAELPAVKGLADLQAYLSDGTSLEVPEGVLCFTMECNNQEEGSMKTELEKRLEGDVETLKASEVKLTGKVGSLTEDNKALQEKHDALEKENKEMKAVTVELADKAIKDEVETFVSAEINSGKILPKSKDAAIATGLALRNASVNLKEGDENPFEAWKAMVTNGAKAVDMSDKGKKGEEDLTGSDAEYDEGAKAGKAAQGIE